MLRSICVSIVSQLIDKVMLKNDLARAFLTTQSFRTNPAGFKLASGAMSPYYVDCRVLMAHPGPRLLVAQLAATMIQDLNVHCIGGLEIGAIAIATAISDQGYRGYPQREWRTFVVRKQAKDHGTAKLIDGAIKPGDQALIVDDVLTSGGSVIKAVLAAREAGLQVTHALVLVDREEQDGRAKVEALGVKLLSLLTIKDLEAAKP
jgi:orotate phosphoribosyltransferase